ncbi:MAG: hypothetical protein U1G08_16730 [Verrucomicrobiota bacterium]
MTSESSTNPPQGTLTAAASEHLREWDPAFAELLERMTSSPWSSGVLPRKTVELVALAFSAASPISMQKASDSASEAPWMREPRVRRSWWC